MGVLGLFVLGHLIVRSSLRWCVEVHPFMIRQISCPAEGFGITGNLGRCRQLQRVISVPIWIIAEPFYQTEWNTLLHELVASFRSHRTASNWWACRPSASCHNADVAGAQNAATTASICPPTQTSAPHDPV